ncbi:bifunctional 2-polyprenyl-6-hydroxyphenol methylase/3-demethylubiquinol 3-O-methyltransferase UbiG [Faucicola boevrei]|uniref:bifunctional 2-polyprenyl-6-hydroxyphenol methylase/3-demethylubiquinol 3-O-methyltransferase UbiG n=1 Tax=Faucicola boevrei TaxID=346665 RepID=UPI00036A6D0F|nr:bifunctional 2-polyprenyl-6-hydroxyphenol methylase/3-demethylubiquinol 3-O-methyltransferase UbiG [Moraxella boevrei]
MSNSSTNADYQEIGKFTALANEWWDKNGAFATLHDINPLRLNWIQEQTKCHQNSDLTGKKVLDVGCGGGILSHSMAERGAVVTGIDLGRENVEVAKIHAEKTAQAIDFQCICVEDLAKTHAGQFDVVTCMEMLEHVPNPQSIIDACFELLKPNGVLVMSTINRNAKSYLFAIIGAEYILRLLDKGTHDFNKFITPAELDRFAERSGFKRQDLIGLHYNPLTKRYWLAQNVDVNYMMAVYRPK